MAIGARWQCLRKQSKTAKESHSRQFLRQTKQPPHLSHRPKRQKAHPHRSSWRGICRALRRGESQRGAAAVVGRSRHRLRRALRLPGVPALLGTETRTAQRDDLASREHDVRLGMRLRQSHQAILFRAQQPCQAGCRQQGLLRNLRPCQRQAQRRLSMRTSLGPVPRPNLVCNRIYPQYALRSVWH